MPTYPLHVLKYSVRHKHDDLANAAAPLTLSRDYDLERVERAFGGPCPAAYQWVRSNTPSPFHIATRSADDNSER